jgi:putative hydrolase of the HAD superfamily
VNESARATFDGVSDRADSTARPVRAVLWDFGGVILSSPFEEFRRYEKAKGLPTDFIRSVNATDPDVNAWARFERNEIDARTFDEAFADESRRLGHEIRGADVLTLLRGELRLDMVRALDDVRTAGYLTACLTNNVAGGDGHSPIDDPAGRAGAIAGVMERFDIVVESSKVGVRKPEPAFYELACALLDVAPDECIFLDDLGINLKPAAVMGMRTIKVVSPRQALDELGDFLDMRFTVSTATPH